MATNDHATKQDLAGLETRLEAKITGVKDQLERKIGDLRDEIVERIRDAQTEILRGFEKFQTAQNVRMRKIEANHSNLDTSTSMRLDNLEERVLEIEKKLMGKDL